MSRCPALHNIIYIPLILNMFCINDFYDQYDMKWFTTDERPCSLVDTASVSGAEGRGFESLQGCPNRGPCKGVRFFML